MVVKIEIKFIFASIKDVVLLTKGLIEDLGYIRNCDL